MAQLPHSPCLCVVAGFSRYQESLQWARKHLEREWGEVALESPQFEFSYTSYYERAMGGQLKKVLWAFRELIPPEQLVRRKQETNRWESDYASMALHAERRPLNLDPGYLTEAKLVLATTKDRDHRIYLGEGIFAEVTLSFRKGNWVQHPWTYPDYQSQGYHQFFLECREHFRRCRA